MKTFLLFLAGIAVGSIVTHQYMKHKQQKEMEAFNEALSELADELEDDIDNDEEESIIVGDLSSILANYDKAKTPHVVISEREFGDQSGYDCISLTYFKNDIMVEEGCSIDESEDMIVQYPERLIGIDIFNDFKNDTETVLYVRNNETKIDYEIQKDYRDWVLSL